MDWLKQGQDMFKAWMDAQQKTWETWTESTRKAAGASESGQWAKTLETWENAFKNLTETQALWVRMWARSVASSARVKGAEDFARSVEELSRIWVDTQQQLMSNWFALFRQMDTARPAEEIQKAMRVWQENMQKLTEAQSEWAEKWAETLKPQSDQT